MEKCKQESGGRGRIGGRSAIVFLGVKVKGKGGESSNSVIMVMCSDGGDGVRR